MKIYSLGEIKPMNTIFPFENGRTINLYQLKDVYISNNRLYYPDVKFISKDLNIAIDPIDEEIMSLKKINKENYIDQKNELIIEISKQPLFFYVYNFDNYYHFIYDTLPYLISFFILKKQIPSIKLLINKPNNQTKDQYIFVKEMFEILGLNECDFVYIKSNVLYKNIYVSNSYTHATDSNSEPRKEIYDFYQKIIKKIKLTKNQDFKKIYVSRRSWIHNDLSNLGTDYTSRRKFENETETVNFLKDKGYQEVFTELLDTKSKINLFYNAEYIVGAIGGGLCNTLFSTKKTKLFAIVSPTFLDINKRFVHSFHNVKVEYIINTKHIEQTEFKKYMRVKVIDKNIIGEIDEIQNDNIIVKYLETKLAGWNKNLNYKTITTKNSNCEKLDNGLNCAWKLETKELERYDL